MSGPSRTEDASGTGEGEPELTLVGTHAERTAEDANAAPIELARGSEVGRYIVLQPAGRGASGRVWVAYDADLDRRVAIKLLDATVGEDPDRRRRLLGEAQAMAKVRHANVVTVFDVGVHADRLYIAMELVEGTTLGAWCRAAPRPHAAIVAVFGAAARGLAAAHAAGVVHRDFKPDNVLVGEGAHPSVKVADFGLARALVRGDGAGVAGDRAGTPAYMSPEHHGGAVVDARSDQFSFCVALFEALWGHRPFRGDTLGELVAASCAGVIDDAGGARVPRRLRSVVLRGLAVAPEQRHRSMDDLIAALERARRPRWPALAALVGSAALLGALWTRLDGTPSVDACTRGTELAAQAWGPAQRDAVVVSPAGYAPAFVTATTERLRDALDDYALRWAQLHDEVCEGQRDATANEPPVAALDCVEDRRAGLAALAEVVAAQPIEVPMVDVVLADLPALSTCRQAAGEHWMPLPAEQVLRAPVTELRAELRDVAMRRTVGVDDTGVVAQLEAMLARAESIGYPHLVASVELELARAHLDVGNAQAALALLDAALARALAAGHDRLAARVISSTLLVASRAPALSLDAERLAAIATALVERAGGDDGILGHVAVQLASIRYERGDTKGSGEQYDLARAAWTRAYGPDEPLLARPILGQAVARLSEGDPDGADRLLTDALRGILATLGPQHTVSIDTLAVRAGVADYRGEWERAIDLMTEALDRTRAVGGDHTGVSSIAYNLAVIAANHGRTALAREQLALSRQTWPFTGDAVVEGEFGQVELLIALAEGRHGEVVRQSDATLELLGVGSSAREHRVAAVIAMRAHGLLGLRRYREALATLDRIAPDSGAARFPGSCLGVLAATAVRDPVATARWLAIGEGYARAGTAEAHCRELAHLVVYDSPSAEQLAAGRRARDGYAAHTFAGNPILTSVDAWLAGQWPPAPSSALAPVPPDR